MRFFRGKLTIVTLGMLLLAGAMFVKVVSAQGTRADIKKDTTVIPITTQIVIPGSKVESAVTGAVVGRVRDLADYLNLVYNWLISIVGIIAAVMMMIGGFQYLTSGGEAGRVKQAKERIGNALFGLVLAFSSYLLLNTINPQLVNLQVPGLAGVRTELAFLPWCDELEVRFGRDSYRVDTADRRIDMEPCGKVGFLIKDDGSRLWCGYKGSIGDNPKDNHCGGEFIAGNWVMSVCLPNGKAPTAGELDALYQEALEILGNNPANLQTLASKLVKVVDGKIQNDQPLTVDEVTKYVKDMITDFHTYINFIGETSWPVSATGLVRSFPQVELERAMFFQAPKVAECGSCPQLTSFRMTRLGLPIGDEACGMWQNIANNANPTDNSFKLSKKKPADAKTGKFWDAAHPNRMYYCGYSESLARCVYSVIACNTGATITIDTSAEEYSATSEYLEAAGALGGAIIGLPVIETDPNIKPGDEKGVIKVASCSDYNNVKLIYCEPIGSEEKGKQTCYNKQTLGSKMFLQAGYATHLANVCDPDPCETKGPGSTCNGPLAAPGVSTARIVARVMTAGLAFATECEK